MSSDEDEGAIGVLHLVSLVRAKAAAKGKAPADDAGDGSTTWSQVAATHNYKNATSDQLTDNGRISKASEVDKVLRMEKKIEVAGIAFKGAVSSDVALSLFESVIKNYSAEERALVFRDSKRSDVVFHGFDQYPIHIADEHKPEEQAAHNALIEPSFITNTTGQCAKNVWPELLAVYEEVKTMVDSKGLFKLASSHLLLCKSTMMCWNYHQDSDGSARHRNGKVKRVDLSVIVELSNSKSDFFIAGAPWALQYAAPGAFYAFDSDLWHRSAR